MKKLTISLIAFLILASCEKSTVGGRQKGKELDMLSFISKNAVINTEGMDQITISAVSIHGRISQINLQKELNKDKNASVYFTNSVGLSAAEDFKVIPYTDQAIKELIATFGKSIKISVITSSSFTKGETTDLDVFNPQLVEITNREELMSVSQGSDITIQWNKDMVNNNPVTISLIGRSHLVSGEQLVDVDFTKLVEDTGSFTITREDLQTFPSDIQFDIVIVRANQQVINNDTVVTMFNSDIVSSRMAIE